jgi:photosystem II stability/assembly factor-like uncharacterized protein
MWSGVFNLILRTEDGGQSWTPFQDRTDNPQGFHLNAIASTGDALYIAGEQGLLLKWDEIAQRFAAVPTPYQGSFFGVLGKPGEVLVYGLRGNVLSQHRWRPELDRPGDRPARQHHRRPRRYPWQLSAVHPGGHMLVSQGTGAQLHLLRRPAPTPVAGAAQSADGALVLAGSRGAQALPVE